VVTATIFGVFFGLILMGVPIAVSLALGALISLAFFTTLPLTAVIQKFFTATDAYALMAIPFFMLAGGLLDKGGVSRRLVNLANAMVGWLPGGLAVVTILSSAFFGAISGSSAATVAAVGSIMLPAMLREGYPLRFSLATIASAGFLGVVIPPSNPMVLYGLSGNVSVGEVFIGGFIPGFLLAGGMSVYAVYYGMKHLKGVVCKPFSLSEMWTALRDALWALIMPLIVLGGIYCGVFTPTEAAAVATFYGLIVGIFVYKELDLKKIHDIFKNAVVTSSMIMFIVATATAFGYVITLELIPKRIATAILSVATTQFSFWFLISVLLFIVGCVMDTSPAIMILTPILLPIAKEFGVDPVAFGVIIVVNLGIGLVTPPVGLNLYVASSLSHTGMEQVINKHLFLYLGCATVILVVLMCFPQIIMLLPGMMK